jgi:type II secretory pathway pseudopilin PulG
MRHTMPGRARAFKLIELLVVCAILALLVALVLPALVTLRAHAAAKQSGNNIRQVIFAAHACAQPHENTQMPPVNGNFPGVGEGNWTGGGSGSFYFHLLPWLDHDLLYRSSKTGPGWDGRSVPNPGTGPASWNQYHYRFADVPSTVLPFLISPSDPTYVYGQPTTSYGVNALSFPASNGPRLPASFPNGTANTVAMAEMAAVGIQAWGGWVCTTDRTWPNDPGFTADRALVPPIAWDSSSDYLDDRPTAFTRSGCVVGMVDGSVRKVPLSISSTVWYQACYPALVSMWGEDW